MADDIALSSLAGRRDVELLLLQRRRAETRLVHERARNARLAIIGVVGLTAVLAYGVHAGWSPFAPYAQVAPLDALSKEFIATRAAHMVLPTPDADVCRELLFHNDTGKFSDAHLMRCDDAVTASTDLPVVEENARTASVRAWFTRK